MSNSRKGFILHFSNLENLEMMLEYGEAENALDAIIKAIIFDISGQKPEPDEFKSPLGTYLFNTLHGQISFDKKDYLEKVRIRQENGKEGGKPKEFNRKDVQTLVNELNESDGLNQDHFKAIRTDNGGVPIMSFVDKKTEKFYLEKSNIFNNNGTRKKKK